MQLNEIHNPHEHATVNLKVILLIFSVILVGVLGYLVWQQYNQSAELPTNSGDDSSAFDDTDKTDQDTKSADTTGWKKYSNSTGNYSILHPSSWPISQKTDDEKVSYTLVGTLPYESGSGWLAIKSFNDTTALARSLSIQKKLEKDALGCKNFVQKKIGDIGLIEFSCPSAMGSGNYIYDVFEDGNKVFELSYIDSNIMKDNEVVLAIIESITFTK